MEWILIAMAVSIVAAWIDRERTARRESETMWEIMHRSKRRKR